jgi:CDP-alcohol phosphatidyltransferase
MLSASAVIAAGFAGWGARLAVAISLATALVLDTADGRLARLQGTSSAFGRWLDQVLDELADITLHAAIAWAAFCATGQPSWLLLGILYASSRYLFQVQSLLGEELEGEMMRRGDSESTTARLAEPPSGQNGRLPGPPNAASGGTSPTRGEAVTLRFRLRARALIFAGSVTAWLTAMVRLIGHADLRWHLWIVLALLGRLDIGLVGYACYFAFRAVAGFLRKAVRYA